MRERIEKLYFDGLLESLGKKSEPLSIDDGNGSKVFPTAIASKELLSKYPYANYSEIQSKYKTSSKVDCTLWLKKMHGGIGSSIIRSKYLKRFNRNKVGAKGTDLYFDTSKGKISIAEAQVVQAYKKTKSFERIVFQDICNSEVLEVVNDLWRKESFVDENKSYEELYKSENLSHFIPMIQNNVKTMGEDGELTDERTAPAGHGYIGFETLASLFNEELRPIEKNLICCIGNGDDLGSCPDRSIVNWMIQEEIPIVLISTTKTNLDLKGGQFSLVDFKDRVELTIIEKAQAEQAGQLELFSKLGLREGDGEALFNTNMVLMNIEVLLKKFKNSSEEEVLKAAIPDLIVNEKKQNGKTFKQLEGALASVLLNLNNYWAKKHGENLVQILNVEAKNRTKFFNPIKSGVDFYSQYFSDFYEFNEDIFHLRKIDKSKIVPKVSTDFDKNEDIDALIP